MAIQNIFNSTFDIRQVLPMALTVVFCCHAVAVASENDRQGEAYHKSGYFGAIELIQLSIDSDDDSLIHIVFHLDDDVDTGEIDFNLFDGDIFQTVDQLIVEDGIPFWDEEQNHFIHSIAVPQGTPVPYRMYLSFDKDAADAFTYIHGTIHLTDIVFDQCTHLVQLTWGEYRIWTHNDFENAPEEPGEDIPFLDYQVIANDGVLGSVPVDQHSLMVSVPEPEMYSFRIRAVITDQDDPEGAFSNSNTIEKDIQWPALDDLQIELVDVVAPTQVDIRITAEGSYDAYVYRLLRRIEPGAEPEPVDTGVMEPGSNMLSFADEVADLGDHPWYYEVHAHVMDGTEECPEPAVVSDAVSTLWFAAEVLDQTEDQLTFAMEFDRFPDADSYTLQQILPGDDTYQDVPTVLGSPHFHDLSGELPLAGELRFRMKGEEAGEEFHSNEVVIFIDPEINIPNALRPSSAFSENRIFKPRFVGFTPDYTITIYDRNGLEIFSSEHSQNAEWDGTINGPNGRPAPEGGYIYRIIYTSATPGVESGEKQGVVYLVR